MIEDDLERLVERAVERVLDRRLPAAPQLTGCWVPRRQLAEQLGVSARTVARLESEGLPGMGAGRLRRFDVQAVRQWLDARGARSADLVLTARADELLARRKRGGR